MGIDTCPDCGRHENDVVMTRCLSCLVFICIGCQKNHNCRKETKP